MSGDITRFNKEPSEEDLRNADIFLMGMALEELFRQRDRIKKPIPRDRVNDLIIDYQQMYKRRTNEYYIPKSARRI